MSGAGLLISEILTNPSGTDSPFEYVELVATKSIDFAVTPYSVVFSDNGTATASGWIAGGTKTYGFSITTGSVNPGDVVYVGGSSMAPTGTKLRTTNTGTTAGDQFGSSNTGVLGNGGANADGVAVFDVGIASLTSSTVPIDALFFGAGIGSAFVSTTTGYQLPVNDRYNGGKVQSTGLFLAPDPASDQLIVATGSYNASTDTYPTPRTWTLSSTATSTTSIALAPTVAAPTAAAVAATTATLGGNAAHEGGSSITERGIVYSKTSDNANPRINGAGVTKVTVSGTTGVFAAGISGLSHNTAYSYAAYATNSVGTAYTSVGTFNTSSPQNTAPVLSGANHFATINASIDDVSNTGNLVANLIASKVADVDGSDSTGIAITAIDNSNGVWQYSTNGGSSWSDIGAVSDTSALLLGADGSSTKVRFVPAPGASGTFSITFRAWDQTSGTAGTKVTTAANGGATAFSTATASSTITVVTANVAPVNTVPGAQMFFQNTTRVFSTALGNAISISDADAGVNAVEVTLTAANGTVSLSGLSGLSFSAGSGTGDATMTFSGTMTAINTALNGLSFTPTANFAGQASLQITTNDLGNTGSGSALSDTDSVSMTILPVVLLNEIKANPPGSVTGGDKYQYVELRGAAGTSLANVYVVALNGNGAAAGVADFVVNLSSASIGSNGLLMIKSPTGGHAPAAGTTIVTDSQFDNPGGALNKNTVSFYLVYSTAAIVETTDFDTDNDGVLDGVLAAALKLDNVGWSDGDAGDKVYGGVALTQNQGTPDAATRFLTNSTASTSLAWYNGDLYDLNGPGGNGDPAELLYDATRRSTNMPLFPATPSLTPGAVNFNEVPVVFMTSSSLGYAEPGATVAIDSGILVMDSDNTTLVSATVAITSGYEVGVDVLSFTNTAGITGSFNSVSGIMTLSGTASVASYQSALRSIKYTNTSGNQLSVPRTVSFVVNDGTASSTPVARDITRYSISYAPVITEFVASNQGGLRDQFGDANDWIEIYNPTSTTIDLYNWSLTDSSGDLNKWKFPHVNIGAKQFLIVFADGKNIKTGQELHTNFSLSADGEYLALVNPSGVVESAFTPSFPVQVRNVSYGAEFDTANFVPLGATAQTLIPSNNNLGTSWTSTSFNPQGWTSGPTGVGFGILQPGFNVTYIKANRSIDNLDIANQIIATPSLQVNVVETTAPRINYMGTGGGGHHGNDLPFPTQTIGTDYDWFLIRATGKVTIPATGNWTFVVNSDDGFGLTLERNGVVFSSSFPGLRGPSDTVATFNIPQAGEWNLTLIAFENGGGASAEMSAAQGSFGSWTSAFRLVGDTASGGLAVNSVPGGNTGNSVVVGTDVSLAMLNQRTSAFVRIPFTVANPLDFDELHLDMNYDDGFVAYLNGVEVARRNAPTTVAYNSTATVKRTITEAITPERIDLTSYLYLLQTGTNVLAIHGLNYLATDSSFLLLPVLSASAMHTDQPRYYVAPTPGSINLNPSLGIVEKAAASVPAGFYTSSFSLSLTTPTAGATIRYTTDGSTPSETNGTVYTGPISIASTTVLRAQAFKPSYISLPSTTWTYLFLDDVILQSPSDDVAGGYPDTGVAPAGWPTTWGNNVVDYGMDQTVVNQVGAAQVKAALLAIPTISITTELANLFNSTTGIYANAGNDGRDWERPASVELLNPDGSAGFQINAGLRIRGGYSRSTGNPKHAFRLFFRSEYGQASLEYPMFGDEGTDTFEALDLRTAQNYSWSFGGDPGNTMIQDGFSRASQGAMGQPYTRSRWYNLYIDGMYWGVYQTEERAQADFAASYFGGTAADYDVVKVEAGPYTIYATDGNLDAYQRLWQSVTTQDLSNNTNYFRLQGKNASGANDPSIPNSDVLVDVDNLIVYMIDILHGGNLDAPISAFLGNQGVNNFYAIRDRTGREGFKYFQHDSEHTLVDVNADRNGPFNAGGPGDFSRFNPQYLHQQLMANAEYRRRFGDLVQQFFFNNGPMTVENAQARYQKDVDALNTAIIAESVRWGDAQRPSSPLTRTNWLSAVSNQRDYFLVNRNSILLTQFKNIGLFPTLSAPQYLVNSVVQNSGHVLPGSQLRFANTGGVMYYTTDGSDPRLIGGGINPSALIYDPSIPSAAIILNASKQFAARSWNGSAWSALTEATYIIAVPAAAGNLAVTEIHYNPVAQPGATQAPFNDKETYEFIELRNIGDQAIDLTGVRFTAGITFDFTSGTVPFLEPGQSVVVVANLQSFELRYGTSVRVAGVYTGSLSNGGETITLINAANATIQSFTYDDDPATSPAWPTTPDGNGPSLTVINVNANYNDPANWRASNIVHGTPGYDEDNDFVPSAPGGVQSVLSGYTSASSAPVPIANQLTWSAAAGAVSYRVERKLGAGGTYTEIGTLTGTSFTDTGLVPGSTYIYRVSGVNAVGSGPYSEELTAATPAVPITPTSAEIVATTSSSISLRWTDNAANESGFQIYRSTGGGAFVLVGNIAANTAAAPSFVNYIDSNLTQGTVYQYQIRAFNLAGTNSSANITATTLLTAPNLVFAQRTNNTATLFFTEPAGATSFNVYRGIASGQLTLLASNVTGSPYADTTLQEGVNYFYYVTAVMGNAVPAANESLPSNEVSPIAGGTTFQWTGAGSNNNWTTPANWLGGVAPTGSASEILSFPAIASQFSSINNYPAGSNLFGGIIVATGGYSFTINNNMALGVGGIVLNGTGNVIISAATPSVGIYLAGSESFNVASGITLVVNAAIEGSANTLTITGGGNVTLNNPIRGTGGLVLSSQGTVTLNGASTYSGNTLISSGAVNLGNNTALGVNSNVTIEQGATVTLQGAATEGMGLYGQYYNVAPDSSKFVDYPTLSNYLSGLSPNLMAFSATTALNGTFDFSSNGSSFPAPYNSGGTNFIAVYTGIFNAPTTGTYTFETGSDDGSMIYIDGNVVVNNNYFQGVTVRSGTVSLTAGAHNIVIAYYQGSGGYGFFANVRIPGGNLQRLPNSMLSAITQSNLQIGGLAGAGTLQLGSNQITTGGSGQSSTFTGVLSGTGTAGLTKTGAGTLVLSQPQYTGTTTISAGSLQFGDGVNPLTSLPTSSITDNGMLILANPAGAALSYTKAISGTGGLTASGSGTLSLSGINNYTGATYVAGGIVNAINNSSLGSMSALTVEQNAVLNLPGTPLPGLVGTYYRTSPNNPNSNSFISLSALTAYVSGLPIIATDRTNTVNSQNNNGANFDYGNVGAGFPASILSNANQFIGVWTGQFNAQSTGSYTFETASDDGSMIFIDGAVVVNNNAYQGLTARSGSITLSQGYHNIVIAYYQGTGGYGMYANVQVPGGTMQRLPNTLLIDSNSLLEFGSLAGGGNVSVADANVSLTVGSNNLTTVYTGVLSGAAGLMKVGTGTLTLGGSNTYAGITTISSGTLVMANNDALGGTAAGTIVRNGGTLGFAGNVALANEAITIYSGSSLANVSGNNSFNSPLTAIVATSAPIKFTSAANTLTINTPVNLPQTNLIVEGAGNVIFSGGINEILAAAPTPVSYVGSQYNLGSAWRTASVEKTYDADGDNVLGTDGWLTFSGSQTIKAPSYLTFGHIDSSYQGNNAYAQIDDPVTTPGVSPSKIFSGVTNQFFPGNGNTTNGVVTFTLAASAPSHIRVGIMTDNTDGGGAYAGQGFQITSSAGGNSGMTTRLQTLGSSDYNMNPDWVFFDIYSGAGQTFSINVKAGTNGCAGIGAISFDTGAPTKLNLQKNGTGNMTLNGASSYTGATTITAGTVEVNSPLLATTPVTVLAGSVLQGTGSIPNSTTTITGTLNAATGSTTGKISLKDFQFAVGGKIKVNIQGTSQGAAVNGYDQFEATGLGNRNNATLQLSLGNYIAPTNAVFTIMTRTGSGALTGIFAGLAEGAIVTPIDSQQQFSIHYAPTVVTLTALQAPTPLITSIAPATGTVTGGTTVIITGVRFTGATQVLFGSNNAASFVVNSDTQITATTPTGSGVVNVSVTTPSGTSANTAADDYTYVTKLTNVVIGDGTGQRSTIRKITLTFNGNIDVGGVGAGSISITNQSNVVIPGLIINVAGAGTNTLVLTFSDTNPNDHLNNFDSPNYGTPVSTGPVTFGSLVDGLYRLKLDGASLLSGGVAVDIDANGAAGGSRNDDFHRLFGDKDGDQTVGTFDYFPSLINAINKELGEPGYDAAWDYDNDDVIGTFDFFPHLVNRFNAEIF